MTQSLQTYSYDFDSLSPGTTYVVLVAVTYKLNNLPVFRNHSQVQYDANTGSYQYVYQWPQDDRQTVTTPADKPLTPGPPYDEIEEGTPYLR